MLPFDLEFPWNQVLRFLPVLVWYIGSETGYQYWYEHGYQISQQSGMTQQSGTSLIPVPG